MVKVKAKSPKWELGLPVMILLCAIFFLAGHFVSMLLSQDLGVVRSSSRLLDESADKEYEALPNGESGEAFVGSIPLQVLSWRPRALYFPNFASPELCRRIIKMEKSKLKPSELALRKWETAESTKGIRTSFGTFLTSSEDKTGTLELIERKIARATMIPKNHGEAFNILRYEEGQKYDSHYDALSSSLYGPQQSHRIATFLVYLSNVEEGGETMFPFEVKPRRGYGLLFYSAFPNGTIDLTSLHGSCPVIMGEKWLQ